MDNPSAETRHYSGHYSEVTVSKVSFMYKSSDLHQDGGCDPGEGSVTLKLSPQGPQTVHASGGTIHLSEC